LFLKKKADYSRYLSEIKKVHSKIVKDNYITTYNLALSTLSSTHPLRTCIALNYSIFHSEILHDKTTAIKIAKATYDE
jgi:hypothetical protein